MVMVLPFALTTEVVARNRVTTARKMPMQKIMAAIMALASASILADICTMEEKQKTAKVIKKTRDLRCLTLLRDSSCKKGRQETFFAFLAFVPEVPRRRDRAGTPSLW